MTVVSFRAANDQKVFGRHPVRRDGAVNRRAGRLRETSGEHFVGATVLVERDGRCLCADRARAMLLGTGLFDRHPDEMGAIRPEGAVKQKLETVARAARNGERPSLILCHEDGAAYVASAGIVPLSGQEVVAIDIRLLLPPTWSDGDLAEAFGLTCREAEVTRCLLHGDPVSSIAARLHLKTATVRQYLKLIYSKTSTASQAQLVAMLTGGFQQDRGAGSGVVERFGPRQ